MSKTEKFTDKLRKISPKLALCFEIYKRFSGGLNDSKLDDISCM